mgnify:CR=1 FL=1
MTRHSNIILNWRIMANIKEIKTMTRHSAIAEMDIINTEAVFKHKELAGEQQ